MFERQLFLSTAGTRSINSYQLIPTFFPYPLEMRDIATTGLAVKPTS